MKAQRRHELKENSLIRSLKQLPSATQQYGSRIALGLILVALVVVIVYNHMRAASDRLQVAQTSLGQASQKLSQLQRDLPYAPGQETALAKQREEDYSDGIKMADDALEKSGEKDPHLKAQALLAKGDLNFTLANLPAVPGAATQPSLQPDEKSDDLLSNAEAAYSEVLSDCPNDLFATTAAHFGLAAVAENRAIKDPTQWDNARQQYQAILDSQTSQGFKNMAASRMTLLAQVQQPILTDVMPLPTSQPTTQPLLGPPAPTVPQMLQPSTQPTTR